MDASEFIYSQRLHFQEGFFLSFGLVGHGNFCGKEGGAFLRRTLSLARSNLLFIIAAAAAVHKKAKVANI